jgi:phosphatidate cytidylyltransferase
MTRVLSGIVLGGLVLLAIWYLPSAYLLAVAEVVALAAFIEYAALTERVGTRMPRVAAATATLVTCAAVAWSAAAIEGVMMTSTLAMAAIVLASGRSGADALHDVAAALFASLYIGLALGALVATHRSAGKQAVLLLLATIVASDTAQYYTGRLAGTRLLAPTISPKKTIEGALGGVVAGTAIMTWLGGLWLPGVPILWRVALGLTVVVLGIGGDLFESLLKRGAGVKDASSLIPGHGGVLDRIDALLFAAPVYYVFVRVTT